MTVSNLMQNLKQTFDGNLFLFCVYAFWNEEPSKILYTGTNTDLFWSHTYIKWRVRFAIRKKLTCSFASTTANSHGQSRNANEMI